MTESKNDLQKQAASLTEAWDERASSELGRFFIASHPGFDDPRTWKDRAVFDAAILCLGISAEQLAGMKVLEIGCGVGRLASVLAPQVASYTGVDLSAVYLEEARQNCHGLPGVRFLQAPGDTLPEELRGESFDFIFAWAVFIHCPQPIIGALVASAHQHLAPEGIFRANVLSDIACDEGRDSPLPESAQGIPEMDVALAAIMDRLGPSASAEESTAKELASADEILANSGLQHLTTERPYMGSRFRHAELQALVEGWMPGRDVVAFLFDGLFLWILAG